MMLLRFTVRNHKSLRDEVSIDLTKPSLATLQPKDGDWMRATYPVAGIFGGNATGKSAILDAMAYAFGAVRWSATSWQADRSMRRFPFQLDGTHENSTSEYVIEFVDNARRFEYGFEVDRDGIKREWLRDVPSTRWRTLIDRDRDENKRSLHATVRGMPQVTARELILSRALLLGDSGLAAIARGLCSQFDMVLVKDSHRAARLGDLTESLVDGSITFSELESLLQLADIGVTHVGVEEQKVPEKFVHAIRRFERDLRSYATGGSDSEEKATHPGEREMVASSEDLDEEATEAIARHLTFRHRGSAAQIPDFSLNDESDGTIAWLALAVPALETLRRGGVLVIDEIDSSLHPHLLDLLLGAFLNKDVNQKAAQLIFTSHETFVLSPLSDVSLEPEQVWFTDKGWDGVTELFSLADFPRHADANVAKRYLAGRYGGTPRLSSSAFYALVGGSSEDIDAVA